MSSSNLADVGRSQLWVYQSFRGLLNIQCHRVQVAPYLHFGHSSETEEGCVFFKRSSVCLMCVCTYLCVCVGAAEAQRRAEAAAGSLLQTSGRGRHRAHPDCRGHER